MINLLKTLLIFAIMMAVFGILAAGIAFYTGHIGKPIKYVIPESYQGWVTIIYGKHDCPQLEESRVFVLIHTDETGNGCTSTQIPKGWRYTKYVYANNDGSYMSLKWDKSSTGMIWAMSNRTPQGGSTHYADVFFVGTKDQLEDAWSSQPK